MIQSPAELTEPRAQWSRPHTLAPAADDTELEDLGNQDIDPKVFAAWGDVMDKAAMEQYIEEQRKAAREDVLDELAEPTIRASEEAEQNGDYVSQTCYEDVLKWIAAIRQQGGKP